MGKNRYKNVSDSDMGQVPLYRSYGVKKKARPLLTAVNLTLSKILMIGIMFWNFVIIAVATFFIFRYGGALLATVAAIVLFWVLIGKHSRIPRRRIGFVRKLKKAGKRNGYQIEYKRGAFESFFWNERPEADIILKADGETYIIKYATATKPLSSFTFLSRSEMRYTKHRTKNRFSLVLDLKDRSREMSISFPEGEGKRIILVNPMARDIFVKNDMGAIVPTGSGESIYGYTVYSGTGFLDMLERVRDEKKVKQQIE